MNNDRTATEAAASGEDDRERASWCEEGAGNDEGAGNVTLHGEDSCECVIKILDPRISRVRDPLRIRTTIAVGLTGVCHAIGGCVS